MLTAIIAGAGALISAGASIYSGYKQKDAAQANAALIEEQAGLQKDAYYDQASRIQTQGEAFIGQQKTGYAGSGVKLDRGSPLAVLNESRKSLQQDISRTRQMGTSALELGRSQANQLRQQGDDAVTAGWLGGASTLLGGLAQGLEGFNFGSGKTAAKGIGVTKEAGAFSRVGTPGKYTSALLNKPKYASPAPEWKRPLRDRIKENWGDRY